MPKVVGFWRAPGVLLSQLIDPLMAQPGQRVLHEQHEGEIHAALIGRESESAGAVSDANGASLLLAGEILAIPASSGGSGGEAFLSAYARDPSCAFLARASGVFSGAVIDRARQRLVLFTDALGLSPLYFQYDRAEGLAFASEQKCLARLRGRAPSLDPRAPEEFLRHGHLVGEATWLTGVELLRPGECLQLDLQSGALERRVYYDLTQETRAPYASFQEAKETIKQALRDAFARALHGLSAVRVPLSGDLTSRLVLAQAIAQGIDVRALTLAEHDSEEALYAQKAAGVAGVVQRTMRPYPQGWLAQRARLGFSAEGVDLSQLRQAPLAPAMTGGHVLQPALFSLILGTRALRGFDDLRVQLLTRHARRAFSASLAFGDRAAQRFPFADPALWSAALRAEVPYLLRDRMCLELAQELHPAYFDDIPIAHGEGRAVPQLLAGAPALKAETAPAAGLDPHALLRGDRALERLLWELLSDAGALYPGYVDAKEGHAAFWAFFKGADAKSLGPLLRYVSLEIWLRQLLRGELTGGLALDASERAAPAAEKSALPASRPDVSVIVPAYNVEAYLGECLNSVCNQELENLEILVVDDGSSDGTPAIIERFARNDPRVRAIRTANSGVYHARNRALELARGRYVSFVDSDDYLHPTMLGKLLEAAERHGADVTFCDVYQFEANGQVKLRNNTLRFKPNTPLNLAAAPEMIADGFTTLWNRLYDRAFLEQQQLRFDERYRISADLLFLQELLAKASTIVRVPEALYFYRFATPKSLTSYDVRNKQYLTHLEITIELIDFWVRQKLFARYAPFVLLKAMRNFLWNTHIDDEKLAQVFAKFHAYLRKLSLSPAAINKIPLFERRALLLVRGGDYSAFRRHVRRYRARMVEAKGGELSRLERVASEVDALRARVKSALSWKMKREANAPRVRLLWPAAKIGVLLARGDGFQLTAEDLQGSQEAQGGRRAKPDVLSAAKHRLLLEADLESALALRKPGAARRILHFSNAFSVPSETFTYDVLTGLENYPDLDNYMMCFDRQLERERPFAKTLHLRGSVRDDLEAGEARTMATIEQVIERVRPDLVHCHFGWVGVPLALWLARQGRELPLVITMHGTDVNMWPARHAWYRDALKGMADARWLSFTTHTEVYRDKLVRLGLRPAQIEVIPNSFDPSFVQGRPRQHFSPGDHLRVISVARMDIWKGHEHLLRGFAKFWREHYANSTLSLVGYGAEEPKLRALVEELGIAEQVRFYGRIQHHEVPVLLRNHDVYVQPSIRHPETLQEEGQPIAVLEAIATGMPVIVTDTGGMAETVRVGSYQGSAWIVPDKDGDAICQALVELSAGSLDARARAAYVAGILEKHARAAQLSRTRAVYARAFVQPARQGQERLRLRRLPGPR